MYFAARIMNNRVHYTHCPVCNSTNINPLLTVKDHSVSKEEFVIWQCSNCTLRFTQDVPDADSIGPYYKSPDYISHTNTNKGAINKAYQKVRTFTLKQKANWIKHFTGLENGKLLDIGAGAGAFLQQMKSEGWEVTGIEPDEDARNIASKHFGLQLLPQEMLQNLQPLSFDAITMWHVMEHVHDLHGYVETLKTLLKPGGKIIIAVPNYQSADADIYKLFWAAYDVPRHLYHFSPKSMEVLMQQHGLRIVAKKPMWFDAFYISLLSSKYKNGKTAWIGSLLSGLRSDIKTAMDKDHCSSITYIISKV
jgi:2-polyprenyl-3-methyl-5-hydroxy-6-metoxy-1,4-benzoquinol methylase